MVGVKSTWNIRRQKREELYTLRGLPFAEGNSRPRQAGRSPRAVSTTERGGLQEACSLTQLPTTACIDGLDFFFLTNWDIRVVPLELVVGCFVKAIFHFLRYALRNRWNFWFGEGYAAEIRVCSVV